MNAYRDHLLRLDLDTLTQLELVKWKADDSTAIICSAKGQSQVKLVLTLVSNIRIYMAGHKNTPKYFCA